jgi:hypothetical protein
VEVCISKKYVVFWSFLIPNSKIILGIVFDSWWYKAGIREEFSRWWV